MGEPGFGGLVYNYYTIFYNSAKVLDPEDMVLVAGLVFSPLRMEQAGAELRGLV